MIFWNNKEGHRLKRDGDLLCWRQNRDSFFGVSDYSIAHSGEVVKW